MLRVAVTDMATRFGQDRDVHYRSQLSALSIDIGLISEADPYGGMPLEDGAAEIDILTKEAGDARRAMGQLLPNLSTSSLSIQKSPLSGRWYAAFVEQINNAMERRDGALVALKDQYDRQRAELRTVHQHRSQLACEEHREMLGTVRQRLINSITAKRSRLQREKEQLDIGDSNAMLLFPNQYSITNHASPDGSGRRTRQHRPRQYEDDGERMTNGINKRKRTSQDGNDGSPMQTYKYGEAAAPSPHKEMRDKIAMKQFESPVYSIDKLFTEKELSMQRRTAAIAASRYFANASADQEPAAKRQRNMIKRAGLTNGTSSNGTGAAMSNGTATPAVNGVQGPSHLNPLLVLGEVAELSRPTSIDGSVPIMPSLTTPLIPVGTKDRPPAAPGFAPVSGDDAETFLRNLREGAKLGPKVLEARLGKQKDMGGFEGMGGEDLLLQSIGGGDARREVGNGATRRATTAARR